MSSLTPILVEVVRRLYPEVRLSEGARFLPMFELDKGEISSTAAIEVARALKGDALAIAATIISELAPRFGGQWKVVAGYIVLTEAPSEIVLKEIRSSAELFASAPTEHRTPRVILCLTPDSTNPVYARVRLVSSCALQALIAIAFEGRCRLGLEPEPPQEVSSVREVLVLYKRAVERILANESPAHGLGEYGLRCPGSAELPTVVWTSHHYHDRFSKVVKKGFSDGRQAGHTLLKIPPDGWLLSRDRALTEILDPQALGKVVAQLRSDEGWLRWLMHMASATPSGDLDPSVALYDECASPRWSLQALRERLSALVPPVYSMSQGELVSHIGGRLDQHRRLFMRALFLPILTKRAAAEGEVLGWMTAVEEFAARGHAVLNAPHLRAALAKPPISSEDMQIVASLVFGIASILPVVTEVACENPQQNSNQQGLM